MDSDRRACSSLSGSFASMKEPFDTSANGFPLSRSSLHPSEPRAASLCSSMPLNREYTYRYFSGLNSYSSSMATSCTFFLPLSPAAPHLHDSYVQHPGHRASDGFEIPSALDSYYYPGQCTYSMPSHDTDHLSPLGRASPDSFLYQSPPLLHPNQQYPGMRPLPPLPPRDLPPSTVRSASLPKKTPPPLPPRSSLRDVPSLRGSRDTFSATMERSFTSGTLQDPLQDPLSVSAHGGMAGLTSGPSSVALASGQSPWPAKTSRVGSAASIPVSTPVGGTVTAVTGAVTGVTGAVTGAVTGGTPAGATGAGGTGAGGSTMTASAAPFVSGQNTERRERGRNQGRRGRWA